jgi:uncharacterized RDD family membrane protein YckC
MYPWGGGSVYGGWLNKCRNKETMNFLPLEISGNKVYAGFWKRFCASFIDALIIVGVTFPLMKTLDLYGSDRSLTIVLSVFRFLLMHMYTVYLHARFGGTFGKLAVGIRVTRPDGNRIGWNQAWRRSSVDIAIALLVLVSEVWAMFQVDWTQVAALGSDERTTRLQEVSPLWDRAIDIFQNVWIWSEVFVVLLNRRKRALHDFIAGTVVVKKQFAEGNER